MLMLPTGSTIACIPKNTKWEVDQVTSIVDGDTIRLNIRCVDYSVRNIGMDSDESGESYGYEASQLNKKLVNGKTVTLIIDVSEIDQFLNF
jgi:endonuclease YncB( thermonuclease family)